MSCDTFVPMTFDDARVRALAGPKRASAMALTEFSARAHHLRLRTECLSPALSARRELAPIAEGEWSHRGDILLGRVVAHELGHVLLGRRALHRGLMRPVFGANDALSADQQATTLTAMETARLVARFQLVPTGPGPSSDVLARGERSPSVRLPPEGGRYVFRLGVGRSLNLTALSHDPHTATAEDRR